MEIPTQKITMPKSGIEIEIKDWIDAKDAEYIDGALYGGFEIKSEGGKPKLGKFDAKVVNEQGHREVEKFIVSVAGIKDKILEEVLSLPEEDHEFIKTEIQKRRPKKKAVDIEQS